MRPSVATDFRYTTTNAKPGGEAAAVVLVDEDELFTGIYRRFWPSGLLWPARTVRVGAEHYDRVIDAWVELAEREGYDLEDWRGQEVPE